MRRTAVRCIDRAGAPASPRPLTVAKISRRASMVAALLAGVQAGPSAASAAPSRDADPAPPGAASDSVLVDLGRRLLEAIAEEERLLAPYYRLVRFSYPPEVAAPLDVLARQQAALRQQIAALPATKMSGLRAKASVVMLWLAPDGEAPVDADDHDAVLAWSLCRDLLVPG